MGRVPAISAPAPKVLGSWPSQTTAVGLILLCFKYSQVPPLPISSCCLELEAKLCKTLQLKGPEPFSRGAPRYFKRTSTPKDFNLDSRYYWAA